MDDRLQGNIRPAMLDQPADGLGLVHGVSLSQHPGTTPGGEFISSPDDTESSFFFAQVFVCYLEPQAAMAVIRHHDARRLGGI